MVTNEQGRIERNTWLSRHSSQELTLELVGTPSFDDIPLDKFGLKDEFAARWGTPASGEFREIAVFCCTAAIQHNRILTRESVDTLMFDVRNVNLASIPSLLDFLKKHGCFTKVHHLSDYNTFHVDGKTYTLQSPFEELLNDGVSFVQPLWSVVRSISIFRIVQELFSGIREGKSSIIARMARIGQPTPRGEEFCGFHVHGYPVELAPHWLLPETRNAFRDTEANTIVMPFEPKTSKQFLALGWRYVTAVLRGVLGGGLGVRIVATNINGTILNSIPDIEDRNCFAHYTGAVGYSPDREVTPPMFEVSYSVTTCEQELYLRLLEMGMKGSFQQQCPICGDFFFPPSGHYRYCSKHNDAEKKWWRRHNVSRDS